MTLFVWYIALITLLDVFGITSAKYYSLSKNPLLLLVTVLFFGAAGFVFAKSLQFEGAAITNVLWISISIFFVTILGYFLFKEDISGLQFAGIGIIMVGLVMINLG
ncbi:MAG: EamA family transporter [Candidatus Gracilibacteria bacterium]|nr:EamA family transporter [bacterium]MDZ4216770.1 EamA family transporter [Candidatus Gracilibacteria bacterium]